MFKRVRCKIAQPERRRAVIPKGLAARPFCVKLPPQAMSFFITDRRYSTQMYHRYDPWAEIVGNFFKMIRVLSTDYAFFDRVMQECVLYSTYKIHKFWNYFYNPC